MKHEQSAPAGYRPRFAGTMKLYLVRHKEYGELTVNGVNKYEAVHAAARAWGVRWTAIARECEYIVLAEDTPEAGIAELPDEVVLEMLVAEAEVIAPAQEAEARAMLSGEYSTGETAQSISYDKKLKKTADGRAIYVYPKGTRKHGNKRRAAEVAFVDEFGKQGQPARPFIQTANEKAADPATDAAARVYDDFLKSKNF